MVLANDAQRRGGSGGLCSCRPHLRLSTLLFFFPLRAEQASATWPMGWQLSTHPRRWRTE